jgi:hypothetical protein
MKKMMKFKVNTREKRRRRPGNGDEGECSGERGREN